MTATIAEKSSGRWPQLCLGLRKVEDIRVRQASTTDAIQIATINVRAWQRAYKGLLPETLLKTLSITGAAQAWRQMLTEETAFVWVIEIGGVIKGFASTGKSMDRDASALTAEIFTIYLEPEYTNSGLGKRLLQTVIDDLRKAAYKDCTVWVLADNEDARRFYEKAGFQNEYNEKIIVMNGEEFQEIRYRITLKK